MKFLIDKCPKCGSDPQGTLEKVEALAMIRFDPITKSWEYSEDDCGQVYWESSTTVTDDQGRISLQCGRCHEWWETKAEDLECA